MDRSNVARSLLLCAAVAATLVAAEIAVRFATFGVPALLRPSRYRPADVGVAGWIEPVRDRRIRYRLTPGRRGWLKGRPFTTNSLGFRDREVSLEAPQGVFRIAALGASISMGSGVADDEVFTRRLQARLDARDPDRFEVLNFAVSGYVLEQMFAVYDVFARPYRPDAVLVPLYVGGIASRPRVRRENRPAGAFDVRRRLDDLFAYQAARMALATWLESDWSERARHRRDDGDGRQNWARLIEFVSQRRDDGVEVWLVPIPSCTPRGVTIPPVPSAFRRLRERHPNFRLLDVRAAYERRAEDVDRIYYGDNHLGPRGHDLVAAAIEEHLHGDGGGRLAKD